MKLYFILEAKLVSGSSMGLSHVFKEALQKIVIM